MLTLSLVFTSCERTLNVESDQLPKLVLNGLLTIGDTVKVELSKTRDLFDDEDEIDWVRNADVILKCNGKKVSETLEYKGEGIYASGSTVAEQGGSYSIEVVHSVYDDIRATAEMPEPTLGRVVFTGTVNDQQNFELNIENGQLNQFFIWEMIQKHGNGSENNVEITSFDSNTDNILPDETQLQEKIFLDALQNINSEGISSGFSTSGIDDVQMNSLVINLITVNEDMYKYYRSLELYKNSTKKFIKPVEIYSNVENGLGIFGAVSNSVIPVTF
jgi:hypothetical protein